MKKWVYIAIALVIASIVAITIKIKSWLKQVNYGVADGVKLKGLSGKNVQVILPIWIYNPSPVSIVFSNLDLKIYMNGYYVSNVQSKSNYKIASKQNSTYPLTINIDPKSLVNLLADQGTIINDPDWMKKVIITVDGTVSADIGIAKINNYHILLTDSLKSYVG